MSRVEGDIDTSAHVGAEEAAYTYQRADGTVEQAQSIEDVIARCPVFGNATLEQAAVMLKLVADGNKIIAQEAQNKEPKVEKIEPLQKGQPQQKPEPIHDTIDTIATIEPLRQREIRAVEEVIEPVQSDIEEIVFMERSTKKLVRQLQEISQEERGQVVESEHVDKPIPTKEEKIPELSSSDGTQYIEAPPLEELVITAEVTETIDLETNTDENLLYNDQIIEPREAIDEPELFSAESKPLVTLETEDTVEPQSEDPAEIFELMIGELLFTEEEVASEDNLAFPIMPQEAESSKLVYVDLLQDIQTGLSEMSPEQRVLLEPTLHEIVEITQFIQVTEALRGDKEVGEAIVERLTDLYKDVLESLEVEYDELDLDELVRVLLTAKIPSVISAEEIELILRDDVGTHERKHFKQFVDSIDTVGAQIQQMLGMMALLHSRSQQPQLVFDM